MLRNKRAGFEMSITTLVVIVIAVIILILGLVFVRQIFGTATKSISIVDQQVRNKLQTMFGEETGLVVTYSRTVDIKAGTQGFSFPFGARTPHGEAISNRNDMKYKLEKGAGDCTGVETWFLQNMGTWTPVDQYEGDTSFSDIIISVPKGTTLCSQKINIDVQYKNQAVGGTSFTINIVRGGIF